MFDLLFFKAELFLCCGKLSNDYTPMSRIGILKTWCVGHNFTPAKFVLSNMQKYHSRGHLPPQKKRENDL